MTPPSPQPRRKDDYRLSGEGSEIFEIDGPCMAPDFKIGDVVLFRDATGQPVEQGHPCIVEFTESAKTPPLFRRVYQHKETLALTAVNPAYEPLVFPANVVKRVLRATQQIRNIHE